MQLHCRQVKATDCARITRPTGHSSRAYVQRCRACFQATTALGQPCVPPPSQWLHEVRVARHTEPGPKRNRCPHSSLRYRIPCRDCGDTDEDAAAQTQNGVAVCETHIQSLCFSGAKVISLFPKASILLILHGDESHQRTTRRISSLSAKKKKDPLQSSDPRSESRRMLRGGTWRCKEEKCRNFGGC